MSMGVWALLAPAGPSRRFASRGRDGRAGGPIRSDGRVGAGEAAGEGGGGVGWGLGLLNLKQNLNIRHVF